MRDISAVAEQLRAVRTAQRNFLGLWAMEQAIILPALDRVAADVDASGSPLGPTKIWSPLNDGGFNVDD